MDETITGVMSNYCFDTGAAGYDDEDRLTNWERDDTNLDQSWNLSAVGDWTSFTENSTVQARTHSSAHEVSLIGTNTITHDARGNVTTDDAGQLMNWDQDNLLTSVDTDADNTVDVTYEYDALLRRVKRTDYTVSVIHVSLGDDLLAEYTSGTTATSPLRTYVYGDRIDQVLAMLTPTDTLYYHADAQTSIRALTTPNGTVTEHYHYSSYGTPTILEPNGTTVRPTSAHNNTRLYTAREWDAAVAMHYFRARWMSSTLGRFIRRDPIEYIDGWNLYRAYFVPRNIDPYGTDVCDCCNHALQDGKDQGTIPNTVPSFNPRRVCPVKISCQNGCDSGFPASTRMAGNRIVICIDCRMSNSNLGQTIAHEIQHAKDFCKNPEIDTRNPDVCRIMEGRACEVSCKFLYPNMGADFNRCKECCVYFSCRHHPGFPQPDTQCNPGLIPTKPCWRYDPGKPGFVPDPTDPRCRKR